MVRKSVLLGFVVILILAVASCGSDAVPATTASTGIGLPSTLDAERAFMKQLGPDVISSVSVIEDRQADKVTDEVVYTELQRLQQAWDGRPAPSTRTQAFLDGWLTDLGTCEKYWALIVKNEVAGAEAMRKEVDEAITGAHLPETLAALVSDLGIYLDTATTEAP